MRKTKGLLLAAVVFALGLYANNLYHEHADIDNAKDMVLIHKSYPIHIDEGLAALAGSDGSLKWDNSDISTSARQHISEVEVEVRYKEPNGQAGTATYYFHVNHDSRRIHLDYFDKNGKMADVVEGLRMISTDKNFAAIQSRP